MINFDGSDGPLADRIGIAFDVYRVDRADYYSREGPEWKALMDVCDRLAELVTDEAVDLVIAPDVWEALPSDGGAHWSGLRQGAEEHGYAQELRQSVEIQIVEDFLTRLRESPDRCLALAELVHEGSVGRSTGRFLGRLGRCYIAGLFPECVILCRAVLENAVRETFDRNGVPLPATERGHASMKTRLTAARLFGWISDGGFEAAQMIWLRGNKAIHDDPEATSDVLGTIRDTMGVVGELYPRS
jgi:hypothetical protein